MRTGRILYYDARIISDPRIVPGWYYQLDMETPVGPFKTQISAGHAAREMIIAAAEADEATKQ